MCSEKDSVCLLTYTFLVDTDKPLYTSIQYNDKICYDGSWMEWFLTSR